MSDEVTVDLFRSARGAASKWRPFVAALEPNIPVKTDRVIDGTVWACWVVDSEQSK